MTAPPELPFQLVIHESGTEDGWAYVRVDDYIKAIAAARTEGREQGLRVKPLEWLGDESQGDDLVAKPDPYHQYTVRPLADCYDVILNHDLGSLWFKAARQERWNSYAEAKAAAESDYYNRISSALIPAPPADGGDNG